MQRGLLVRTAACFGFLAVALGAFGAHALKALLDANGNAAIWQTAVFYHLSHSIASLWAGNKFPAAARFWLAGVFIFSGSLYILAITNIRWLGAITPIGGLLLLAGWVMVIIGKSGNGD